MTEKIMVFNGYGTSNKKGSELARWVKGLRPKVAIVSEIGRLDDDLEAIGKVFVNRKDTPHDTAIVVLGRIPGVFSWIGWQLTRFVDRSHTPTPMMWRDRWAVRVRIRNRVYYSIHANAIISDSGEWRDNPGARVWRKALRELHRSIRSDMDKGFRVRVGGDFNFPQSDEPISPNNFFESLGLEYTNDRRVMWLAWDPTKDRMVSKQILPTAPGADAHKTIFVELEKRKRRQ